MNSVGFINKRHSLEKDRNNLNANFLKCLLGSYRAMISGNGVHSKPSLKKTTKL